METASKRKRPRELYAAGISMTVCALALILALIASYSSFAWFGANRRVGAEGLSVQAVDIGLCREVNYYRCTQTRLETDSMGEKYNSYFFSYADSALDFTVTGANGNAVRERESFREAIPMLPYSDLSGHCQVLIEVVVAAPGTYALSVLTDTASYLGTELADAIAAFNTATTADDVDITPTGLPLTSVVNFAILPTVTVDEVGSTFSLSEQTFSPIAETFVHFDGNGVGSFVPAFHDYPNSRQTVTVGEDCRFYIFVDYYMDAVEDVVNKTMQYVDKALSLDAAYDTIVIGETNLQFRTDFFFELELSGEVAAS